jgi:hypothetical protein
MKPEVYTKAVLITAIMLTAIACKLLISPETSAIAQSSQFSGLQYSDGELFNAHAMRVSSYCYPGLA